MKLTSLLKNKKTVGVAVVVAIVVAAMGLSNGNFLSGSIRNVSPLNKKVTGGPAVACSYTPANPKVGEMVTFTASSTGFYDNNDVTFQWTGAANGYAKTFKRQFVGAGSYIATVTGSYEIGDVATETASANCNVKVTGSALQNVQIQPVQTNSPDKYKYNQ